ncbi:MAG: hypothetical protein ACOYVF_07540 [Candidatus Zixiibacteriota bacterium]
MKKTIVWLFLLILLTGAACNDKSNNDNPEITSIMKLAVGNVWTYESSRIDSLGIVLSVDTLDITIYRDTVINTETWYITSDETPLKVNSMLIHRDDGLWICGPPESMLAKYPADINDTWTDGSDANRFWLKAKGVVATVPKGTFSTYKYLTRPTDVYSADSALLYYAPGYGMVKSRQWTASSNREELRLELIEMVLNY